MSEAKPANDDHDPSSISIDEARARILTFLSAITDVETLPLASAMGRIASSSIVSTIDVPRFRASAMDGYAFRHVDAENPLRLSGRSLAGHPYAGIIEDGHCVRVTTGARVPDDADTVVQQENVRIEGEEIHVTTLPDQGLHVRDTGSDSRHGSTLIQANTRLAASELALLAAHGIGKVDVLRPLRVGMFSTGDELVEAGNEAGNGQIYDANRVLLGALLADAGIEIADMGICRDDRHELDRLFASGHSVDALVSSGGVSVGEADHVRDALAERGHVHIWKIAMKPGRPLTFGQTAEGKPFFGLPGNPVSAAITALMFVRPALDHMLGLTDPLPPSLRAKATEPMQKRPGRVEFQRGVLSVDATGATIVRSAGAQDSHVLAALQRANCLIELPLESSGVDTDDDVVVHPFTRFARSPM